MADRRKFQSGKLHKGVIIAFLLVFGGAGLFSYQSLKPVFAKPPANTTVITKGKSDGSTGSVGNLSGGQLGVNSNADSIREAALERDRQLLAKIKQRKHGKQIDAELAHDPNYDAEANKERVQKDYDDVKKTKTLSKSMKSDFKQHYRNMMLD